jgi:hypothetical protein
MVWSWQHENIKGCYQFQKNKIPNRPWVRDLKTLLVAPPGLEPGSTV